MRRVAALLVASALWGPAAASTSDAMLKLTPCRLAHPQGLGSVEARCGTLEVAEEPARPAGRRVGLSIAVLTVGR